MTHVKFNGRPFATTFNSLVDDLLTELPEMVKTNFNEMERKGNVPVNVKENEKSYILEVVAPGFEKADFKINLENEILTVAGEKKKDNLNEAANQKEIRREYHFRSFKRTFTLDEKIDATAIEASYINGILTLNLPKVEPVKQTVKEIVIN
jgi:HSP20 family protein